MNAICKTGFIAANAGNHAGPEDGFGPVQAKPSLGKMFLAHSINLNYVESPGLRAQARRYQNQRRERTSNAK
ncbi:MAG: hypothetical protein KGJ60_04095 [Verrucomicrobiota bacterium]|nr:hypothetical protein [Verrucomicrobiota bacterium]